MQKLFGMITLFLVMLLVIPVNKSSATTFTVTSNPIWTDTGITVLATQTVTFTNPTASWTYGDPSYFGPGGSYLPGATWDEWITDGWHGEMIAYIGNPSGDLNSTPRIISQNDPGLFVIGASGATIAGLSGELWLGFNDAYTTDGSGIGDNLGTGSVNIEVVPFPPTLLLFGSGLLGLAGWRKLRKA